jgi:hypothetical protein
MEAISLNIVWRFEMKKVIIDIDTIHFVHIKEVLLELDKNRDKKR